MTDKGPGTSDEWIDGDILFSDDLLDSMSNLKSHKLLKATDPDASIGSESVFGFIAHSTTTYSVVVNDGTGTYRIYQSTDSGITWTDKNSDIDTTPMIIGSRSDRTLGFTFEIGVAASECIYTADSGANWTKKTDIPFTTKSYDADMPASGLIVACGDDGGNANHIVYSTDQGGTWNDPSVAPSAACYDVAMFDTSTGYAIDTAGNIWKTTDGGDNWADTTDNVPAFSASVQSNQMYCVSADLVIVSGDNWIFRYTNSTNTFDGYRVTGLRKAGIVETDGGRIYVLQQGASDTELFITDDDGVNWKIWKNDIVNLGNADYYKHLISVVGTTNNILVARSASSIMQIGMDD